MKKRHSARRRGGLPFLAYRVHSTRPEDYNQHLDLILALFGTVRKQRTLESGLAAIKKAYERYLGGRLRNRNGTLIRPEFPPVILATKDLMISLSTCEEPEIPFVVFELYLSILDKPVRVTFYREEGGAILAVFNERLANGRGGLLCYSPIDGHTTCSSDYLRELPAARQDEYGALHAHLEAIGYRKLIVYSAL